MKTGKGTLTRTIIIVLAACPFLMGCKKAEEERSRVGFHVKGVRLAVEGVTKEIAREERDFYGMRVATDRLGRALDGLPGRVEKKAETRVAERKQSAEQAVKLFEELRPTLESLKFDEGEVQAKFDELNRLLDEVERS
jgi:hypothetical protein